METEYDLNKVIEKMVYDCVRSLIPLIESGKTRFTAEDIAARYGYKSKDTVRRMMRQGDFGEVINITSDGSGAGRQNVVTLEGLLAYEERRKGIIRDKPSKKPARQRINKPAVGRI